MHTPDDARDARAGGHDAPAPEGDAGRAALVRLRRFGGEDLVRDMSAILLHDVPARLGSARRALRVGDARGVELAAHSMKSSCAQFGADAVASVCAAAERAAREGELDALPALLDDVERRFAHFRRWLEREVDLPTGRE